MRRALRGGFELVGAVLTVGLIGYAVVGPGAVLTVALLAARFYAVLVHERVRGQRAVGHLFVAVSAGLCGVLLLAALNDGLQVVASGGRFDSDGLDPTTGGRRFLGWTDGRHWLLSEPRTTATG